MSDFWLEYAKETENLCIYDGLMFNDAYTKAKRMCEEYENSRDYIDEEQQCD